MVPSIRSTDRRFAFFHWVLQGEFSQLQRYYQSATTSCCPSCRTSFPSLGSTSVALGCLLLNGRVLRQGLELVTRWLQPGCCRGDDRISQVPGEPRLSVCTCSHPTPAGLLAPDHNGTAAWPLVSEKQRLPREGFRRSIAWLSDSLSTLRRTGYPATTQDSLPVAGQALLDGLSTRKVPTKGFKVVSLHLILLSQALLGTIRFTAALWRFARFIVQSPLPVIYWHLPGISWILGACGYNRRRPEPGSFSRTCR
jgi:hypothetical protein